LTLVLVSVLILVWLRFWFWRWFCTGFGLVFVFCFGFGSSLVLVFGPKFHEAKVKGSLDIYDSSGNVNYPGPARPCLDTGYYLNKAWIFILALSISFRFNKFKKSFH